MRGLSATGARRSQSGIEMTDHSGKLEGARRIFLISDLCEIVESYLPPEEVREIYRAYLFGAEAHNGQHRASGEPFIYQPLAVARLLAEMRVDYQTLAAAILHDVIEDTETVKDQLAERFGSDIAELVDGVSKLDRMHFDTRAEAQAETYRKMLLAMSRDIRVILVKLTDRLHNMRTLDALKPGKRRTIAKETLEIYAPIANRLGLNKIRLELEDLGFKALYPMRYRVLTRQVVKARGHRKQVVEKIETGLKRRMEQEDLEGQVVGREKHLFSLYTKMRTKHLSFSDVLDVYAFRIIVDSVDACYRILGTVHNLYKPVPGKFKDYIAIPKSNGYQSLHTALFGPYGVPIEVQIRSREMDAVAESGIAAHWIYKGSQEGANAAQKRAREWMRELLEMQKHAGNSIEFIENVKVDLFPDEVYVFTPTGEIMELPKGATPVDFAYAVHTGVGNTCVACKIDRRYAPLRSTLDSGQTVEIVTEPWGHPSAGWLSFVVTGKARTNIRAWLKNLRRGESVELGRRLLVHALAQESMSLKEMPEERIDGLLEEFGLSSFDSLLGDIGLGKQLANLVARKLIPLSRAPDADAPRPEVGSRPLFIRGTEGMVIQFAKCCRPIPGDHIVGFVSVGRGVVIHRASCKNLSDAMDQRDKWLDVDWETEVSGEFIAEIRVDVIDQKGALATIAAAIADTNANIENVTITERDGVNTSLTFLIDVSNRKHLAGIMRRLRAMRRVIRIVRGAG